jgi:hypothetical protein
MLNEGGVPTAIAQVSIGHDSEATHELNVLVDRESAAESGGATT